MGSSETGIGRLQRAFGRVRKWLRLGREELVEKASEFGEAEELWASLEKESDHIELILRDESVERYSMLLDQVEGTANWLESMDPRKPSEYWDKPVIELSLFSTATSGSIVAPTSYRVVRPEPWKSLHADIVNLTERRNDRQTVANLLSKLSPRLGQQFLQAWQTWHSATKERRKGAMYLMRDTLHDTVVHLSKPGGRFPGEGIYDSDKKRIEWIADNLVSDDTTKQLIHNQAHRYADLCGRKGLSKAHEPSLDEVEAHALLLEAQEFLLLLLSSLDWTSVGAKGLCA